jgi:perosamine synthetase
VVVQDPRSLILDLREVGLDASQATSSIVVVEADAGSLLPARARRMMSGIVFLPVYPDLPPHALDAMVDLVNRAAGKAVEQVTLS